MSRLSSRIVAAKSLTAAAQLRILWAVARIKTAFTEILGCELPLIGAPMFLVSNTAMVSAISEAGGVGVFPALNFRPIAAYKQALNEIRRQTARPFGVNIIVNKSNQRRQDDLACALDAGVPFFITSLGHPGEVIREAHKSGAKVFCDVTNLEHALKVEDLGADGVIAVATGAGGHAGPISPVVLIPWLKAKLRIPIVAAGGVADGSGWYAMQALGASAVSVGTRFIASSEAGVDAAYKQAVVSATPEDIVLTTRISGTPASVIRTPYVEKLGLDLPWIVKLLKDHPRTKNWSKDWIVPLIHWLGMQSLEQAATKPTWKSVWSAGQSVGLIDDIRTCGEIIEQMVVEYGRAQSQTPKLS